MKETLYFSHDCNARNDSKLQKLQMKHGLEGVGCYWCIIEMLYEEKGYISIEEYERISFELRTNYELIKNVIESYGLFVIVEGKFTSNSVLKRLEKRKEKSEKARKSVEARWSKCSDNQEEIDLDENECNTNVSENDTNVILKRKEKEKNIKETTTKVVAKKSAAKAATLKRRDEFYNSLAPYAEKYSADMLRKFFDCWSEMNRSETKMRFEGERTWELSKRLATWASREKEFKRGSPGMKILKPQTAEKENKLLEKLK